MTTRLENGVRVTLSAAEEAVRATQAAEMATTVADATAAKALSVAREAAVAALLEEQLDARAADPDTPQAVTDYIALRDAP